MIKILLVVGSANDVFIHNYAKWLKLNEEIELDIFEFSNSKAQKVSTEYYNHIYSANCNRWFHNVPGVRTILTPFFKSYDLEQFLNKQQYDIIHCHWLVNSVVLTTNFKQHTKALVATFWGGEYKQQIVYSNQWYMHKLKLFLKKVDRLIGSKISCDAQIERFPFLQNKCSYGALGSAPMEFLYKILESENKNYTKDYWKIPKDKKSVLLGYSGKSLHQHLNIINAIKFHSKRLDSIHLLAPMTRGASTSYIKDVETALKNSGCSYTLLKDMFLTDEEVAKLRVATDIVLQFSLFDAFSRSIVECFCAKSIVLYGNWLEDYDKHLAAYGFKGIKVTSINQGISEMDKVVDCFDEYRQITFENSKNGKNETLWSECIKPWIKVYKELV